MPREVSSESKRSTPVSILAHIDDVDVPVADPIEDALLSALETWSRERDVRGVRRALLAVLAELDELP
jgi:hypothetical protein